MVTIGVLEMRRKRNFGRGTAGLLIRAWRVTCSLLEYYCYYSGVSLDFQQLHEYHWQPSGIDNQHRWEYMTTIAQ